VQITLQKTGKAVLVKIREICGEEIRVSVQNISLFNISYCFDWCCYIFSPTSSVPTISAAIYTRLHRVV